MTKGDPWSGRGWFYRLALILWGVEHLIRIHLADTLHHTLRTLRNRLRRLVKARPPPPR